MAQPNFIIWGAYHGLLLVTWRLACKIRPSIENPSSRTVKLGQWIIMFGLINVGWLIFREQNPVYLWKFITSSPLGISSEEWQTGLYFFAYSLILATPLAIHCWTDKWCTGDDHWESRQQNWKWVIAQSALAGILLTAIFLLKSENSSNLSTHLSRKLHTACNIHALYAYFFFSLIGGFPPER